MTRHRDKATVYFSFLALFIALVSVQGAVEDEVCVKEATQFRGQRHFTVSGKECVPWKDITPALSAGLFPESTIDDAENFCRNPEAKAKPYCYTDAKTKEFELCNIEKCNDKRTYQMTTATCQGGHVQDFMGFVNGDIKTVSYGNYPDMQGKGMPFMGCMVRIEGCKRCRFYVKIEAKLPICQGVSSGSKLHSCPANCQTVAVFDESYNSTKGIVVARAPGTAETVTAEYWSTSNVLQVKYCQMNSVTAEQLAAFRVTIYTTTKEEHYHSDSGVIKSPNFPYGYFSRSEIYMYSVQAPGPVIDTNMTLLFYDWDLNASAGSKVTVRWGSANLTDSVEYIASSSRILRPALLIPSNHFTFEFETGSITDWQKDKAVGFLANYATYKGPVWEEKPDTDCGGYLSVSESWGGKLVYDKSPDQNLNATYYIDCIWVIKIPEYYSKIRYWQNKYTKDSGAELSLTLRNGLTSEDSTLPLDSSERVASNKGIFLHLKGFYTTAVSLDVSYVTYAIPSPSVKCSNIPNSFYCPEYVFCLNMQLFQQWGVAKCKADPEIITVAPILCNAHGKFACKDRSRCYTSLQQCNGVNECKDGSDEVDCLPIDSGYNDDDNGNVAAIVIPIVIVFILVPVVVVSVYLCKKKSDEKKDEELMMNKQELIQHNGGPNMQGFDNLGMEMDEVPISMIAREEQAMSRAASQQLEGAVGGNVAVHEPPRPAPRETQSYRVSLPYEKTAPPARGTQSYRFPNDVDAITEMPEESPKKSRRSDMPQERPPPPPSGPPPDDRQRQYRKRGEKPMTLGDYRPGADPKRRHPLPEEDRTPEGRSFRGDQPQKYPPPLHIVDDGPRSPGDGASGSRTPTRERAEKLHPRRPGDQLPGRETQSYRHPPTDYDHEAKPSNRPTRSYRFEPDRPEILLKPDPRQADVRPKSRPKDISGAHKKTLGQYRPKGADPRDPKPPRETQLLDDPKQYKPGKYDQLPDRQTQSYRYPPPSNDDSMNSADELRSKSYRFAGSQSELPRTPTSPKSPNATFEVSGTTSV